MPPRFALYTAPAADDPLHDWAAEWLGRDPESGEDFPPVPAAGLSPTRVADLTADPRLYGFHGTLKPPFRLAEDSDEAKLIMALEQFTASRAPVKGPPLKAAALGSFLALRPSAPCPALEALAADCVMQFDRFRAPLSETELAKRRKSPLTDRQEQYLQTWGYPYVLEEFRLHFTLTGPIRDEAERSALLQHLAAETAALTKTDYVAEEICLFVQPQAGEAFRIAGRYRFNG